jgi:hypothetical protein
VGCILPPLRGFYFFLNTHGIRRFAASLIAASLILTAKKVRRSDNRHIFRNQPVGQSATRKSRPFQGRYEGTMEMGFRPSGCC